MLSLGLMAQIKINQPRIEPKLLGRHLNNLSCLSAPYSQDLQLRDTRVIQIYL